MGKPRKERTNSAPVGASSTYTGYVGTWLSPTTGLSAIYDAVGPLPGMVAAPRSMRCNAWLQAPAMGVYTLVIVADDGVSVALNNVSLIAANWPTTGVMNTYTAMAGVAMTVGNVYQLGVGYRNYAGSGLFCLLWQQPDGVVETVPGTALRARNRRGYYSFGGAVVAMKEGLMASVTRTLTYLHGDHLGSTSLTTNAAGQKVSEQRYKPYGEVRWTSGAGMPTDPSTDQINDSLRAGFTFTSQQASSYGTIFMSAREYSPSQCGFLSADSIVPGEGNLGLPRFSGEVVRRVRRSQQCDTGTDGADIVGG